MSERKEPYFSTRIHVGEMTTEKRLGIKTRSIEVTFGNRDAVLICDKDDIARVLDSQNIAKKVWDEWENITAEGHKRGHIFLEDVPK